MKFRGDFVEISLRFQWDFNFEWPRWPVNPGNIISGFKARLFGLLGVALIYVDSDWSTTRRLSRVSVDSELAEAKGQRTAEGTVPIKQHNTTSKYNSYLCELALFEQKKTNIALAVVI